MAHQHWNPPYRHSSGCSGILKHSARLYLLIWTALGVCVVATVLMQDYYQAKQQFSRLSAELAGHVADRAMVTETALEGFCAFVASLAPCRA